MIYRPRDGFKILCLCFSLWTINAFWLCHSLTSLMTDSVLLVGHQSTTVPGFPSWARGRSKVGQGRACGVPCCQRHGGIARTPLKITCFCFLFIPSIILCATAVVVYLMVSLLPSSTLIEPAGITQHRRIILREAPHPPYSWVHASLHFSARRGQQCTFPRQQCFRV